jgi:quinol monooxygenase YgiN
MTIARHYTMSAAENKADQLISVLGDLTAALKGIAGFEGAELIRDVDNPNRFVFIEKWESVAAHKAGGPHLPKSVLSSMGEVMAGRPEGAYLEYLKI